MTSSFLILNTLIVERPMPVKSVEIQYPPIDVVGQLAEEGITPVSSSPMVGRRTMISATGFSTSGGLGKELRKYAGAPNGAPRELEVSKLPFTDFDRQHCLIFEMRVSEKFSDVLFVIQRKANHPLKCMGHGRKDFDCYTYFPLISGRSLGLGTFSEAFPWTMRTKWQ
ncbi:hypothetical protein TNCV_459821 [Trichonephila clavipes]|nr:hypothetical protein TNCV_459821 [Trichonephila clavipes]